MIGCSIDHQYEVLPEAWVFLPKDGLKFVEVSNHDRLVGVRLGKGDVGVALGIDGTDDFNVLGEVLISQGILIALGCPFAPTEIQIGAPVLVNAKEPLALGEQCQHPLGVVLAEHQSPIEVAGKIHSLYSAEAHVEVIAQHLVGQLLPDTDSKVLFNLLYDLLARPDVLLSRLEIQYSGFDGIPLLLLELLSKHDLGEVLGVFLVLSSDVDS